MICTLQVPLTDQPADKFGRRATRSQTKTKREDSGNKSANRRPPTPEQFRATLRWKMITSSKQLKELMRTPSNQSWLDKRKSSARWRHLICSTSVSKCPKEQSSPPHGGKTFPSVTSGDVGSSLQSSNATTPTWKGSTPLAARRRRAGWWTCMQSSMVTQPCT